MKNSKTYIIAEIGNTHEGSIQLAKKIADSAINCGVDAVKFQTHIFDAESLSCAPNPPYFTDESRKEYFDRTSFNRNEWRTLKEHIENKGVAFLSSVFSFESIDLLLSIGVNSFKIPSGEVSNIPMLEYLESKNPKKVYLSSGMSSYIEIANAVEIFYDNKNIELTIFQCTSEYPCPPEESGLNVLNELKKMYPEAKIGYSDHTLGNEISIAAVILGASVIEKHFTLSKEMYGSDAKFSSTPKEFKKLVESIRKVDLAINNNVDKDMKASKLKNMKTTFEKSIVFRKDLEKDHILKLEDLDFKKPGNGISASLYKQFIGKSLKSSVKKNEMLNKNNFI